MKLNKKLTVNGVKAELVGEQITLRSLAPGDAIFQVRVGEADEAPERFQGGEISFSMGWNVQNTLIKYFCGDIESATPAGEGLYRLKCLERSAKLNAQLPLALRHPTLKEVIQAYAGATGLRFIVPDRPYASRRVPAFYALGSGFHGLSSLGDIFNVPDYFWQTQGDGQIFVGGFTDSNWNGKLPVMPSGFFSGATAGGKRSLPAVPVLRPGVILNGRRILGVSFSGHQMEITT